MVTTQERVQVIVEAFTKGFNNSMNAVRNNIIGVNNVVNKFHGRMILLKESLRRFQMEMLGILFFGMAINNLFSSMLKPALDLFGVFDLWSTTLAVVFLPTISAIFPYLLQLMEWMMNFSPTTKIVIGVIAVLGMVLGKLLFIIGTLSLGLNSLFGSNLIVMVTGALKTVTAFFVGLSSLALVIIGVILVAIVGFVSAWKTNFGQIRDWVYVVFTGIKNFVAGVINFISGIVKIMVGIVTGDWSLIKEGFIQAWEGIKQYIVGAVQAIIGIIQVIWISLIKGAMVAINFVIGLLNKIPGVDIGKIGNFDEAEIKSSISVPENTTTGNNQNNVTNNFYGFTQEDLDRKLDERDRLLVDDLNRQSPS